MSRSTEVRDLLDGGRFASRQIYGKSGLVAWSHRRRFDFALELGRLFAGKSILDYGCGDGTFLTMLMASDAPPARAVGAERNPDVVKDCRERLSSVEGLDFILQEMAGDPAHKGRYDAVFCMEVLEHALEPDSILEDLDSLLAPEGTLVVSVPVESGPPLLVKQFGRRLAGLRGVRGYTSHSGYTAGELLRALFAGPQTRIPRIIHGSGNGQGFYDHKGFNWMAMRRRIAERFTLDRTVGSPFRRLGPYLGSQVWFLARKRAIGA